MNPEVRHFISDVLRNSFSVLGLLIHSFTLPTTALGVRDANKVRP